MQSIIIPWGDIAITHIQVVVNMDDVPEEAFNEQDTLVNQQVYFASLNKSLYLNLNIQTFFDAIF